MKRIYAFLAAASALALAACAEPQTPDAAQDASAEPTDQSDAAPAKAQADAWLTDFEEAKALSRDSGRPILANFTGSDWCPPCIQIKRDILTTERFKAYASENLVLLELDFPRRTPQPEELKRQNQQLASDFAVRGFPTLALLSPQGEELARHVGYMPGGPERFVEWADSAQPR